MKKTREQIIKEATEALSKIENLDSIHGFINIPVKNGAWFAMVIFQKVVNGWEVKYVNE